MESNNLEISLAAINNDNINKVELKNDSCNLNHLSYDVTYSSRPCYDRYFGKINEGSLRGGIFSIVSITFGSGCLLFPEAVFNVGPIVALILFSLVTILSYWTLYILLWSGMKTGLMDYNKMLEDLVGIKFRIFSDINNILLTIGVIMTYQNIISQFTHELLKDFFNIDETANLKLILMFSMMLLTQLPLSLLRDISKLQFASILGTFSLIYVIVVMLIEFPGQLITNLKEKSIEWFPPINWKILDTLAIFLFGFCHHNGIFPVFKELKNPTDKRNFKLLDRSVLLEVMVYIAIGFSGFFSAYPFMVDVIIRARCYSGVAMKIGKIALIITLICNIAINYNVMRQSFKTMFFSGNIIPFVYELLIAFFLYMIITYLTYAINKITIIMGFVGGFCTCLLCFFNPIVIYIQCCGHSKAHWKVILSIIGCILMSGIGVSATIYSFYNAIFGE